ncbi:hypothetical protein PGB90_007907 [Kerria lacca]
MFQHLFVTLLMYFITINCGTSSSDIMIDSDDSVEANREVSNNIIDKEIKMQNNNICHIEVQVTRHILGYCIKHGLASHSCVADGYFYPLHRECLSSA